MKRVEYYSRFGVIMMRETRIKNGPQVLCLHRQTLGGIHGPKNRILSFCKLLAKAVFNFRSPDGSCLLTCCADRRLRLFDLPSSLYTLGESQPEKLSDPLQPSLTISENGDVYDYEWYPFMSSWNPQSAWLVNDAEL